MNELADKLGIDPVQLRLRNMVREGQVMPAYYNEKTLACALDRCMLRCADLFDWEHRRTPRVQPDGRSGRPAWRWPCRAPAFPAWTWVPLPSSWTIRAATP